MLDEFYPYKNLDSLTLVWCIELVGRVIAVRLDYFLGQREKGVCEKKSLLSAI